jgi:hypothetical protein
MWDSGARVERNMQRMGKMVIVGRYNELHCTYSCGFAVRLLW